MAKLMNTKFQKICIMKVFIVYLMHPCWIKNILHHVLTTRDATRFQRQEMWVSTPDAMQHHNTTESVK